MAFLCKRCQTKLYVVRTRAYGERVMRKRQCRKCGVLQITWEAISTSNKVSRQTCHPR